MQARLALLMFLQFTLPGALLPIFSLRLKDLGFSPMEIAWCCATHGVGALLAPLAAQLADRYFSAEKCVSVFCLLGSLLLIFLSQVTSVFWVATLTLAFWLLIVPMMMLCSTICFTHLKDPVKEFGLVRLSGTLGWMLPGWLLLGVSRISAHDNWTGAAQEQFLAGSFFGILVAAYSLTLPYTPPKPNKQEKFAPFAALKLLKGWPFATYCLCTWGICVTMPFNHASNANAFGTPGHCPTLAQPNLDYFAIGRGS